MRIDAPIIDLALYAHGLQELKQLRANDSDGNRTPESKRAAEKKLAELKKARARLHRHDPDLKLDAEGFGEIQKRGIDLQVAFHDWLLQTPQELLDSLPTFTANGSISNAELIVIKSVAEESLRRHALVEGATARFLRSARKKLGRESNNHTIDDELRLEVGRQIFEAKTSQEANGKVYWEPSPLAVTIEVQNLDDVRTLAPDMPAGHSNSHATFWTGVFRIQTLPFIFYRHDKPGTLPHEQSHAKNEILKNGLQKIHRRLKDLLFGHEEPIIELAGKIGLGKTSRANTKIQSIIHEVQRDMTIEEGVSEIESVLKPDLWEDSLTRAKNEIIGEFEAAQNFSILKHLLKHPLRWNGDQPTLDQVKKNNQTLFQYLNDSGLDPSQFDAVPELHDQVAASYNQVLRDNVGYLEKIWQTFSKEPDDNLWYERLLAFMRHNPLMSWRSQGEEVFGKEYNEITLNQARQQTVNAFQNLELHQPKSA